MIDLLVVLGYIAAFAVVLALIKRHDTGSFKAWWKG